MKQVLNLPLHCTFFHNSKTPVPDRFSVCKIAQEDAGLVQKKPHCYHIIQFRHQNVEHQMAKSG